MIAVFNAITNIAEDIEKNVFVDCDRFISNGLSDKQMNEQVRSYCSGVIRREFSRTKSIHSYIGRQHKNLRVNNENGKYKVSYVSIDNIDLLDVNFSLGSLFGIYEKQMDAFHLKAAIYVTYGPTFQLVFASKMDGVQYFSFEDGEFIEQDNLTLKEEGKINSTGGLVPEWSDEHKELVEGFFNKGYRLRFSDSLCLDTHQILFKKGGIYTSPPSQTYPDGKLHTIFEAFPIAYIIELAGGRAINKAGRILNMTTTDINAKTPIYFGSKNEVQIVEDSFLNK